jgi:hypothetical protein
MSFYLALYAAAEAGDEALIRDILKRPDACIDERCGDNFLSAAGTLAKDKKFAAAELLMNKFGAAPLHVMYGLIDAGELEKAEALTNQFDMRVEDLTEGVHFNFGGVEGFKPSQLKYYRRYSIHQCYQTALQSDACRDRFNILANAGNFKFIRANKQKLPEAKKTVFAAAGHGGHIDYIEKNIGWPTNKNQTQISQALAWTQLDYDIGPAINRFQNLRLALHTLSFIKNKKFFFKLLNGLGRCMKSLGFNLIKVADQALKIQKIMESDNLGFSQA